MTLVYDQAFSRDKRLGSAYTQLGRKLDGICEDGVHGMAYHAQAPFLILSCDGELIKDARQRLLRVGIPSHRIVVPLPR